MSNTFVKEKIAHYIGSGDSALEDFCDAILSTEDGYTFKVHRVILSKNSVYFQTLFLASGPQKPGTEYLLTQFSGQALSQVLHYLYSGEVYLDSDNIEEMLLASNYYLMEKLFLKCQTFAKQHLSVTNCLKIFIVSYETDRLELYRFSRRFICLKFSNILDLPRNDISDVPFELFKNLLEDDSLNVPDERYIWRAVEQWVGKSSERLSTVHEFFSKVRFSHLNNNLLQYLQESDILRNNPSLKELNDILVSTNLPDLGVKLKNALSLKYPKTDFKRPRHPKRLYLIANVTDTERELYITYNEDFYIRRKLTLDRDFIFEPNLIFIVENLICIFQYYSRNVILFNLIDRTWEDIFFCPFWIRFIFQKSNFIYVVGNNRDLSLDGILDFQGVFQRYDLNTQTLDHLGSLPTCETAAMIGNKIYIHAKNRFTNVRIIGEYDISRGTLICLPRLPECFRPLDGFYFRQMVASDDQLFVISHDEEYLYTVEVFIPETGVWEKVQSPPTGLRSFGSRILDGKLVIFDTYYPNWSPVYWNKTTKVWTPFQTKNFHLLKTHWFYPIEDYDTITSLMNENRSPVHQWEYFDEIF